VPRRALKTIACAGGISEAMSKPIQQRSTDLRAICGLGLRLCSLVLLIGCVWGLGKPVREAIE